MNRMDKFGDMDLFVRIVRAGGLAAAGREIGLSPASVSARINSLEQRYNARLLNRTTRSVSTTEAGQAFYDDCISILADLAEAENRLGSSRNQLAGPLRITAPSDLGQQHIAPLLSQLTKKHSGVIAHLHLSDEIINLTELNVDIALRYGEPRDSSLIAKRLCKNSRVLCASKGYIERKGSPKIPKDLLEHDCLGMFQFMEPMTRWHFSKDGEKQTVEIKPARSSNDGAVVRRWAIEGHGIALKSIIDVADDLQSGRLIQVLDAYSPNFQRSISLNHIDLCAVYPTRQFVPERVRIFIDLLETHFKTIPVSIQSQNCCPTS